MKRQNALSPSIPYPQAEHDRARLVLMHVPEDELAYGSLHPEAALFRSAIDIRSAQKEHVQLQRILEDAGCRIVTLREILLRGCVDHTGQWIESTETDGLRKLARLSLTYTDGGGMSQSLLRQEKDKYINTFSPNALVRILIQRPKLALRKVNFNTGIEAQYNLQPLMNLYYTRDQVITTARGPILCRMHSEQRQNECALVAFCLTKLGYPPIHRITGEGAFIEGGDYIPMRDFDLIGCGLRTTMPAIEQLMDRDLLGKDMLVVVHDRRLQQAQMHLDTYFGIADADLALMSAARIQAAANDDAYLNVTIYAREDAQHPYRKVAADKSFGEFLREQGIRVVAVAEEDCHRLATNFLCIGPREIVLVSGLSEGLIRTLRDLGVKIHTARIPNLMHGYGAVHCMTQVLLRER